MNNLEDFHILKEFQDFLKEWSKTEPGSNERLLLIFNYNKKCGGYIPPHVEEKVRLLNQ